VVVADVNLERGQQVAEAVRQQTDRDAIAVETDVTNGQHVQAMVQSAMDRFDRLDILVANAGIADTFEITAFPEERWRQIIDVNLVGYFLCAKAAAKVMKAQKNGVIIQINTKSGKKGSLWNSAYSASKFGGIGLTQSIALDLAPYNVRVNAVCPGNLLDSPLWVEDLYAKYAVKLNVTPEEVRAIYEAKVPLKRGCTYEDVGNLVIFLASDQASYMTGQAINVTGGQEMR
jgi:sorbitol-6-phosphate 2-dehydrogenase